MIIGINAICIGTIFCEAIAIRASIARRIYLFPETYLDIFDEITFVNPECAIVAANVPNKM